MKTFYTHQGVSLQIEGRIVVLVVARKVERVSSVNMNLFSRWNKVCTDPTQPGEQRGMGVVWRKFPGLPLPDKVLILLEGRGSCSQVGYQRVWVPRLPSKAHQQSKQFPKFFIKCLVFELELMMNSLFVLYVDNMFIQINDTFFFHFIYDLQLL